MSLDVSIRREILRGKKLWSPRDFVGNNLDFSFGIVLPTLPLTELHSVDSESKQRHQSEEAFAIVRKLAEQCVPRSDSRHLPDTVTFKASKLSPKKDRGASESAIISAIDRTWKTHADNLLHIMKVCVGSSHRNYDGKMKDLENIMLQLQRGVSKVNHLPSHLESAAKSITSYSGISRPKVIYTAASFVLEETNKAGRQLVNINGHLTPDIYLYCCCFKIGVLEATF